MAPDRLASALNGPRRFVMTVERSSHHRDTADQFVVQVWKLELGQTHEENRVLSQMSEGHQGKQYGMEPWGSSQTLVRAKANIRGGGNYCYEAT